MDGWGCCVIWFGVCLGLWFDWFLSVFVFMCLAVFWVVLVCLCLVVTCLGWVGLFISCRCYHLAEFGVGVSWCFVVVAFCWMGGSV